MDNFGFKEPGITSKPSRRVRINRTISVYSGKDASPSPEEQPLNSPRRKSFSNASVRWRRDHDKMHLSNFDFITGGPPTPVDVTPTAHLSYEESSAELNIMIEPDTIEENLIEQAQEASVRTQFVDSMRSKTITAETIFTAMESAPLLEKNMCLLLAAFHKRWDLLDPLLMVGADLNFYDSHGMSALHLSSFVGCLACTGLLLSKGADANGLVKNFSPLHCAAFGNSPEAAKLLINNGAITTLLTEKMGCQESILHCAVRANAVECLQMFINLEEIDVNSIEPSGANSIHLASELGMTPCLEVLLESKNVNADVTTRIRDKKYTALHLAADRGNAKCVDLLLIKGADANLNNHRGFTALHLAARSSNVECVESLLKVGNADPNAQDYDKRTPLHIAISKSERAFEVVEMLIRWGADVNKKDEYGFTPLHTAASDGLSDCVETLIYHDADVTTKSKKGTCVLNVITRKTPASMSMISRKLDKAITVLNADETRDREVELQFDFCYILRNCHPREIHYLKTFVDEGQKEILLHPLCSAFLHIKWEKIRKYYLARLLFRFVFVVFLSLYILTALAKNCYNISKDLEEETERELCQKQSILGELLRKNPFVIETQWWVLVGITIFEILRKLYGIVGYSTVKQYVTQPENFMDWFVIVSVFLISPMYTHTNGKFSTYTWQNHVGAFAVLAGWANMMLMVGQLPAFGSYVAMYQKVQKEFAKLFMAYVCILIGFTISFCVIFPDTSRFANPFVGFITVVMMMIGEHDLDILLNDPNGVDPPFLLEISAQITYILFLMFVTIVLMNLLVGIAVPDIQKLRKTAGLSKLVQQTKLISYMELALVNSFLSKFLLNVIPQSILVSPQPHRVILSVKPLNPEEKRLPKDIMKAAYNIGLLKKSNSHIVSTKGPKSALTGSLNRAFNKNLGERFDYETSIREMEMKYDEEVMMINNLKTDVSELKELIKTQQKMMQKLFPAVVLENLEPIYKPS